LSYANYGKRTNERYKFMQEDWAVAAEHRSSEYLPQGMIQLQQRCMTIAMGWDDIRCGIYMESIEI